MFTQEQYNTAEEAFKSLNIGEKFDKRHTARRCKAVEKALKNGRWTKYATARDYSTIFRNYLNRLRPKPSVFNYT